jgi:hypothetical protein
MNIGLYSVINKRFAQSRRLPLVKETIVHTNIQLQPRQNDILQRHLGHNQ